MAVEDVVDHAPIIEARDECGKAGDHNATASHTSHATTATAEKQGLQPMQAVIQGDTKVFNISADVVQWEIIPGVKEEAWVYNGQLPGPLIRV